MDSNSYAVCLLILVSIIVICWCNEAYLTSYADSSVLWSLPYTHDVLHRGVLDGFCLLVLANLHDGSVNLATIDDRAWRVGTAQCKCRNGIACLVKLQVVEINLAIGNEVNKSVTVDVAEILGRLCLGGRFVRSDNGSQNIPTDNGIRTERVRRTFGCREVTDTLYLDRLTIYYFSVVSLDLWTIIYGTTRLINLVWKSVTVQVNECGKSLAGIAGVAVRTSYCIAFPFASVPRSHTCIERTAYRRTCRSAKCSRLVAETLADSL